MAQNEPIFNGLNGYKLFRMCKSSGGGITFKGVPGAMACLPRNEQLLGIEAAKRVQTLFRSRDWAEFVNNSNDKILSTGSSCLKIKICSNNLRSEFVAILLAYLRNGEKTSFLAAPFITVARDLLSKTSLSLNFIPIDIPSHRCRQLEVSKCNKRHI